ncbi:thioredoxin-like domain-containing protein [Lophiotrema nucula]|uniref:Thioredoxin-like domain-containing protein n=1 Tax=Lophiotrema nucula TaxID=690887 RepID=A0A6A5ZDV1_9PLEO|nr:thioredoxin-like domain-containing protein [Lophiotrema nucula]
MRTLLNIAILCAFVNFGLASSTQSASRKHFDQLLSLKRSFLVAFSSSTFDASDSAGFQTIFSQTAGSVETPFVSIDCEEETDLCRQYDVNAYPAVRLFHPSEDEESEEIVVERYRGRRTKDALKSFIIKWEYRALAKIEKNQISEFKELDDYIMIAYLPPDQDYPLELYRSVASKYSRTLIFGYSTDPEIAATEKDVGVPGIKCYRNTDGAHQWMNGPYSESNIEQFIETCTQPPLIGQFTERNMEEYMQRGKLSVYIFVTNDDDATRVRKELTPLATKFQQIAKVGVADAIEYGPMAKNFGLLDDVFPALVVHAPHNDHVFLYKQGRRILASVFEDMVTTILNARAVNGQVFGEEAPVMNERDKSSKTGNHDEL